MKTRKWFFERGFLILAGAGLMLATLWSVATLFAGDASPAEKKAAEQNGIWRTDYKEALAVAKEKGLPVLIDFTGSDWCPWCVKLEREVFSQEAFRKYAEKSLVLLKVDFPRRKPLSAEQKAQNRKLADQYQVRGFPTVLLTGADGKTFAITGYRPGGVEKYIEYLKELISKRTPMKNAVEKKELETLWKTDYNEALSVAKEKGLPVLIDFTGSDWCPWCVKLEREVFSQEAFRKYAEKSLVLLKVDFPRRKPLSAEQKAQNRKLADQYQVRGFPTVLLTGADGKTFAITGYRPDGVEKYIEHLKELISKRMPK